MPAAGILDPLSNLFSKSHMDGDTRFLDPAVLSQIDNLELVARYIVEGFLIGLHKSPYHGISSEFSAYRKYSKGDPYKLIDWKVAAKTDRLYIRQFEDQTNTRCYLLVDISGSMQYGGESALPDGKTGQGIRKWRYARDLAGALAYLLNRQGDACGLALFASSLKQLIPPRGGSMHLQTMLGALSKVRPEEQTDSVTGLSGLPERLSRRGLVILIGDLLDETGRVIETLKKFRIHRHELLVFQVLSPEEREFPFTENIEFVDLETQKTLTAQASYIASAYKEAMLRHQTAILNFCRENDIDFIPLSTNELLSTALVAFLNKRRRLR